MKLTIEILDELLLGSKAADPYKNITWFERRILPDSEFGIYSKEMFYKYPSIFYTPDVMLLRVGKNKDLFMVIRRDFILRVLNSEKSTSRW